MSYGLVCKNANGDIQFDSTKQMDSYVVSARGTGSSVTVNSSCLVFVQGTSSTSGKTIWGDVSGNTLTFKAWSPLPSNSNTTVSLPYIVCSRSTDIIVPSGETYGLRVYNPDGTVQFDSRSVKNDKHFTITDYQERLTLNGNPFDVNEPFLTTSTSEYVEIKRYSSNSIASAQEFTISGIKSSGTNGKTYKYHGQVRFEITTELGTFYQDFNTTNFSTILIAKLT